jgi:hypothetical protein
LKYTKPLPSPFNFAVSANQAGSSSPPDQAVITNSKDLQDSIYTRLRFPEGGACIRLLTRNGVVGCAAPSSDTITGQLVAVTITTRADEIPPGSVALISAEEAGKFLQRCVLEIELQNTLAGVFIQYSAVDFPGWNEASAAPYAEYAVHEMQRDYPWNPAGLDLGSVSFPFPIYQLDNETSANAVQRAEYNREQKTKTGGGGGIGGESTAVHVARMELHMQATGNASSCINDKTCYPLGGYSVWAALPPLPPLYNQRAGPNKMENQLPTLLVIAQIDSTSLFHRLTQAADSPLSGLIAMMAAAQALGSIENTPLVPEQRYQKRIIFLAVMGEPWDFMGSRRLLWEMENGTLSVQGLDLESIEGIIEIGQVGRAKKILRTHSNDTTTTTTTTEAEEVGVSSTENETRTRDMSTTSTLYTAINTSNSKNVFSSNNNSATAAASATSVYQLYGHVEKSGASGTAAAPLLARLQELAAGTGTGTGTGATTGTSTTLGVRLSSASTTTPGLPPSTSSSFLRQRPEIPVVVLEEFNTEFINSAYHSQYDTVESISTTNNNSYTTTSGDVSDFQKEEEKFDQNGISATALFLASALHSLAAESEQVEEVPLQINTTAVEETVDQLVGCLAMPSPGMGCSLVQAMMTPSTSGPAGHYIGILRTVAQSKSSQV